MSNLSFPEICEVVENINTATGLCYCEFGIQLEVGSNSNVDFIKFGGVYLWDSENDEREYIDYDNDEKEPLNRYIIREMRKIVSDTVECMRGLENEVE